MRILRDTWGVPHIFGATDADQVPLIQERRTKPVWMDEADIRAHLEREYRPGEE